MKPETLAIHHTKDSTEEIKAVSSSIHLSTTYLRNEDGRFTNDYRYSRLDNPNRRQLEKSLAILEKGEVAYTFSSGMGAINAVFQSLKSGDHILIPDDVFFNVHMLLNDVFNRWNLRLTKVDMSDLEDVSKAIQSNTKLIWIETPSNPLLKVINIEAIVKIAKSNNIRVGVDNTWLTPVLLNPIELGVDIVMHSTTKYFGGHSDVMGGCLVLKKNNELSEKIKQIQLLSGAVPSPFDCWLIIRGIKTLPLRIKEQSKSAEKLANYLESHPKIKKVNYPGLKNNAQYEISKKQMKNGYGAMLSVLISGNKNTAISISNNLKLFTTATSLGGVESLIEHRESVEGPHTTTPDNLLRISVGLEHIDDLIADWEQALE
ncbi:PLP-dependent aspartate aminotransferase family protein [uncultured Aquimarina sp.]|uniref:trans-sulfuration enzyme family protein n=1 Tax=uncultured Aquimarina sp. TaxID=575652 RepID=UPI00262E24AD|nr:PLP-dependent aspartate aminotransferase family protein [uncultured Aquimarina sp.]